MGCYEGPALETLRSPYTATYVAILYVRTIHSAMRGHGGKVGPAIEHRSGIARDSNPVRNHFKAHSVGFERMSTAPFSASSTARPRDNSIEQVLKFFEES